MRSLLLLCCIGLTCTLCAQTNKPKQFTISFHSGDAEPDSSGMVKLSQFISYIQAKQADIDSVHIYGFADSVGSDYSNQQLSASRTAYIQAFLDQKLAVAADRWHLSYFGEDTGVATSMPWQQRAVLVRVWLHPQTQPEPNWQSSATIFASLEELGPKWQSCTIDPTRDTTFICSNGTLVDIPANSFDVPAYLKGYPVEVNIREYYTYSDLIMGGMTTVSNNQTLETSGSVNMQAAVNGTPVSLAPAAQIRVGFIANSTGDGFSLFFGETTEAGTINWVLENTDNMQLAKPKRIKLKSMLSFTLADTTVCPYFTCGLSKDAQWLFHHSATMRRRTYTRIDWERYLAYLDSMRMQYNAVSFNDLQLKIKAYNKKLDLVARYMTNSNKIGYMNCDRYYEIPADKKTDIFVYGEQHKNAICLAFAHDYNALIATNFFDSTSIGFTGLLKESTYTIVMIKYDGEYYHLFKETCQTNNPVYLTPTYKKVSKHDLQLILSGINYIQPTDV